MGVVDQEVCSNSMALTAFRAASDAVAFQKDSAAPLGSSTIRHGVQAGQASHSFSMAGHLRGGMVPIALRNTKSSSHRSSSFGRRGFHGRRGTDCSKG
jgi:hypothetical protein